jgi:hypothetical protein
MANFRSAFERPIDPRYPTNLTILVVILIFGVIAFVLSLTNALPLVDVLLNAVMTGATVLITWMISREISPDYEYASIFAAVIAGFVSIIAGSPEVDLLASFSLILFLRIVNRLVGPPATLPDAIIVLVILIVLAITSHHWVLVPVGALALLVDGVLKPARPIHLVFALLGGGITVAMVALDRIEPIDPSLSAIALIFMIVATAIHIATIAASREVKSVCDLPGYTISPLRVQIGMVLALFVALGMGIWYADSGIQWILPAWMAIVGVGLFRLPMTIGALRVKTQKAG